MNKFPHTSENLAQLIKQTQEKNPQEDSHEAFKGIFNQLADRVFAYACPRTECREDAMDITQETFIELWNTLNKFQYRSDNEFYGFVFLLARRRLARYYKKRKKTLPLEEIKIEKYYEMDIGENRSYLRRYLGALASNYQELLQLRYWLDMTYGEIALVMDINENTAKVWHHRAIKQLKDLINKHGESI